MESSELTGKPSAIVDSESFGSRVPLMERVDDLPMFHDSRRTLMALKAVRWELESNLRNADE